MGDRLRGDGGLEEVYTPEDWPLHDIVIANIVWCIAYKGGIGGGAYIAKWACKLIVLQ